MRLTLLMSLIFCSLSQSAHSSIPFPISVTCPIGGEKFDTYEIHAYTVFGNRPDGKPYGSARFPIAVPVCPTNKLVMFDDFTASELSELEGIILSAEYREISQRHTPFYRAYRLAKAIGRNADEQRGLLLQAIWETDETGDIRKAYLNEFLNFSTLVDGGGLTLTDAWWQVRYANAERELRQFEKAQNRLARLDTIEIVKASDNDDFNAELKALRSYVKKLQKTVRKLDSSLTPRSLVSRDWIENWEYD